MPKMKAAYLIEPKKFEIRKVAIPEPLPNEVLVKIMNCGICGTDIHIFNGHYAADKLPLIPGHEFSGVIVKLGQNVKHLKIEQRVTADINKGCGHCYYCRRNEILNCPEVSQIGIHENGAFAEYIAVPANLILTAPDDAQFDLLSLVEPVACVVRAARKANVTFGQSVVVIGAGPIGNLHVQLMRNIGATPIFVVDLSQKRVDMAIESGADYGVTDMDDLKELVLKHTDGRGADLVIESVGMPKLYELAMDLIRPGGHLSAFGIAKEIDHLSVNLLNLVLKETSIKGSVAGMGQDMYDALTLILHGRFKVDAFTHNVYVLDDIQSAFENLTKDDKQLKTQISIGH